MTALCPCGSGTPEPACCGLYLAGTPAPTALALMRSRYTAYVRGAIDYVLATHDPATRGDVDVPAVTRWSHDTNWLGLEILSTAGGAATDTTGIVEFIARGVTDSEPFAQRERARFRKLDGAWVYTDGKTGALPATRVATPGRNEPCPCGSGQKYKRCHGA